MSELRNVPLSVLDLAPIPEGGTASGALHATIELAQRAEHHHQPVKERHALARKPEHERFQSGGQSRRDTETDQRPACQKHPEIVRHRK